MPDQPPFSVLCVDDEDNRLSVALVLTPERYRVLEAATGAEALRMARDADLVILDVQLPDLSGVEVCRRIKADPATCLVPVILCPATSPGTRTRPGDWRAGGTCT